MVRTSSHGSQGCSFLYQPPAEGFLFTGSGDRCHLDVKALVASQVAH